MANYSAGTVTITEGSPIVTGAGTRFRIGAKVGRRICFSGINAPYQIGRVVDDATLVLVKPVVFTGFSDGALSLTGQSYTIVDAYTPNLSVPIIGKDDIDKQPRFVRGWSIIDEAAATVLGWEVETQVRPSDATLGLDCSLDNGAFF